MMPAAVGVDDERFAASPDGRADFFIAFADTADLTPTYYINWNAWGHLVETKPPPTQHKPTSRPGGTRAASPTSRSGSTTPSL